MADDPNQAAAITAVTTGLANRPVTVPQLSATLVTVIGLVFASIATLRSQIAGMAFQAPSSVAVTGGTINGTAIGATTPAAVTGTVITGTSVSAGTGAVSGGSGSFTGTMTAASHVVGFRNVTGSGSVTLGSTDYIVCINKTTGSATAVTGPASPIVGQPYVLKDCKGDAGTNNITFTPASGNVDGATSLTLNQPYQAINLVYNGTQFNAF